MYEYKESDDWLGESITMGDPTEVCLRRRPCVGREHRRCAKCGLFAGVGVDDRPACIRHPLADVLVYRSRLVDVITHSV